MYLKYCEWFVFRHFEPMPQDFKSAPLALWQMDNYGQFENLNDLMGLHSEWYTENATHNSKPQVLTVSDWYMIGWP